MTIKQSIREASKALIGAMLASSLMLQLVLGTASSAAHGADRSQGLDRLRILCSVSEGRGAPDGTAPQEAHHGNDSSGCCTWGGSADPSLQTIPHVTGFVFAYDNAVRPIVFLHNDAAEQLTPFALRRQAPRAPPTLI